MTRHEVIRQIVLQARSNGFDFRSWYRAFVAPEWPGFEPAVEHLCRGRNCYALLFSHEFAQTFWKAGLQMSFMVPAVSYPQRRKDGQVIMVHRRAFARRMLKADSWLYHLREMVEAPHPLKYIRRFIVLQEDILAAQQGGPISAREATQLATGSDHAVAHLQAEQRNPAAESLAAHPDKSGNHSLQNAPSVQHGMQTHMPPEPIRRDPGEVSERLIS